MAGAGFVFGSLCRLFAEKKNSILPVFSGRVYLCVELLRVSCFASFWTAPLHRHLVLCRRRIDAIPNRIGSQQSHSVATEAVVTRSAFSIGSTLSSRLIRRRSRLAVYSNGRTDRRTKAQEAEEASERPAEYESQCVIK